MDYSGNFEWVNEGFTRMYGYSLQNLIKERGHNIIEASSHPEIKKLLSEWKGSISPISYETLNHTRDKKKLWAQTTISPVLDSFGNIRKLIAIDSDISDIKKAEEIIIQKNLDITDSISYAKRIQEAILPNPNVLHDHISSFFILHKPKDIVSGDFYWFSQVNSKIVIVVADCTGHGVPGAFMSLIGITFLNKIVNEKNIYNADEILNRLRNNVVNSLHQADEGNESLDGMDISLIVYDKKENTIEYAGAMNSIYIIRNNKLIEYYADRMPIGMYEFINKPFTKQTIKVKEGDNIYLFTDGYPDQFGGENNTKLKYHRFKELLLKHHTLLHEKQQETLEQELNNWRGKNEQVDDILVMGIKI